MLCFWRHPCRRNCEPFQIIIYTSYLIKIKETRVENIGISVQGFCLDWKHFYIQVPNIRAFIVSRNIILLMTVVNFETKTEKHGKVATVWQIVVAKGKKVAANG